MNFFPNLRIFKLNSTKSHAKKELKDFGATQTNDNHPLSPQKWYHLLPGKEVINFFEVKEKA